MNNLIKLNYKKYIILIYRIVLKNKTARIYKQFTKNGNISKSNVGN
jgi:hypothetical protein